MTANRRISVGKLLLVLLFALLLGAGLYWHELTTIQTDYFTGRAGQIGRVEVEVTDHRDRIGQTVRISASTGLEVDFRTLRPATPDPAAFPVVLLIGGQETGKDAVDLVEDLDGAAYVAIDYPYAGTRDIRGVGQALGAVPGIQKAFLDTPPALILVLNWLLLQDWVDPDRVELVGVSLGVPFAAVAGAIDERFARIWLIHGSLDNRSWIEFALRRHIDNRILRNGTARFVHLLMYGRSFDTEYWIRRTKRRPLILIAAQDDDRVPPGAVQSIRLLSQEPNVELLWTDGQHIEPDRVDVLNQLLRSVSSRVRDNPPPATR